MSACVCVVNVGCKIYSFAEKEVNDLNAELHLVKEELKDSRDMVNRLNKLIDDMHVSF